MSKLPNILTKVGIVPKTVRINQVWDTDVNEIVAAIEDNDTRIVNIETGEAPSVIDVSAEWTTGLSFNCTAANFPVLGTFYAATAGTVTSSAAHATLDRIDTIVAASGSPGVISIIEGTPASTSVVVGPDIDLSLYYPIKDVIIRALATSPENTSTELLYDENIGEPTEWVATENTTATEIVVSSTNDSYSGTKSIEFTTSSDSDILTLTNSSTISTGSVDLITFYIKLKADLGSKNILLKFYDGASKVGNTYQFGDGDHGLVSSTLTWQKITINKYSLALPIVNIDVMTIQINSASFTGAYIDLIKFHQGSGNTYTNPNVPTSTSQLINDGSDTVNPFISLADLPPASNPLPLSYSVVWAGTGLVFDCLASRYYIVDTYYSATAAQITLDAADGSNDRIDLIVANTSGVISKITGTPAPSPAEPNYDLATQFPLKFIVVAASATVPSGVTNTTVYDENLGNPTEWDSENTITGHPYSGVAGDYASTEEAYSGTKSTKLSLNNNDYAAWSNSTGIVVTDINAITFWIKLPQDMTGKALTSIINLSNQEISTTGLGWVWKGVDLVDGIDLTSTAWQQFTISSGITTISETYFGIGFTMKSFNIIFVEGSGLVASIYIDKVEIQTDTVAPVIPPTGSYAPLSHVTDYANPHQVTPTQLTLVDAGSLFTATEVEGALQENRTAIDLNTAKVTYPSADSTKVGYLSVTQAVDLDTMESDITNNNTKVLIIAFSDETTAIDAGTGKVTFTMPNYATTLTGVAVSFVAAPTTSAITIDLNEAGTSVLSTKITVDATEFTSETAATAPVISDSAIAANAIMSVDVDTADSGGTSAGGKLIIYYTKA